MTTPLPRTVDLLLEATVLGSFSRIGPAVRRRLDGWEPLPRLDGRRVLVTGVTSGIGRAATDQLLRLGAEVLAVGRDEERTATAAAELAEATGNDAIEVLVADLGDLAAVRRLADQALARGPLHALVHNAGALLDRHTTTADGLETTVAVHLVGPHLLTRLLEPALTAADGPARVLWVTSGGMYTQGLDVDRLEMRPSSYKGSVAYARAKRAQVELLGQWARRLAPGAVAHAMHPGWAATPGVSESLPTFDKVLGPLLRSPAEGADTLVWLAAADEATRSSGDLWLDRRRRSTVHVPGTGTDDAERERLWAWVEARAGLAPDPMPSDRPQKEE
jgi:NAD(P)-dependent dehydrogenase (short-subunit alcohol dehydrogenase family)